MGKSKFIRWFKAAGIRALRTVCQAAIGAIGTAATIQEVNWKYVVGTVALAGVISLLMSIKGLPELEVNNGD